MPAKMFYGQVKGGAAGSHYIHKAEYLEVGANNVVSINCNA
jgi:hypothetical protein